MKSNRNVWAWISLVVGVIGIGVCFSRPDMKQTMGSLFPAIVWAAIIVGAIFGVSSVFLIADHLRVRLKSRADEPSRFVPLKMATDLGELHFYRVWMSFVLSDGRKISGLASTLTLGGRPGILVAIPNENDGFAGEEGFFIDALVSWSSLDEEAARDAALDALHEQNDG
jgi:hypothetical protein